MIAGRPTFSGETWSDVLARVIERAPDSQLLPGTTPPALRRLLERCLQKNPAKRWHHIGDVALDLDLAATERALPDARGASPRAGWREAAAWLLAILAGTAAGVSWWRTSETPRPVTSFELRAQSGLAFGIFQAAPNATLAPDGRSLVFEATGGSASSLWIRTLDDSTPRELPNLCRSRRAAAAVQYRARLAKHRSP
jgi:eukaryotic-like serine/threonine-protein kinase